MAIGLAVLRMSISCVVRLDGRTGSTNYYQTIKAETDSRISETGGRRKSLIPSRI